MALRFNPTSAPLFLPAPDAAHMPPSLLHGINPEVSEALLPFVYDPDPAEAYLANAANNDAPAAFTGAPIVGDAASAGFTGAPMVGGAAAFLGPPAIKHENAKIAEQHFNKKPRASPASFVPDIQQTWYGGGGGNQPLPQLPNFPMSLPQQPPMAFSRGADENKSGGGGGNGSHQAAQSAAARERRKRISQKTAELLRLIPGGHRLTTAEMLQEAARHIKFLQAQVGMLALMRSVESSSEKGKGTMSVMPAQEQKGKMPAMATPEEMHALLMSRRVQQRLAAEGKCLVPRELVDAMAKDKDVRSDPLLNRELGRFMASLDKQKQ